MKDWPEAFWGLMFILAACILSAIGLFKHSPDTAAVITLSTGIITGTFGYLKGRSDGAKSVQVPTDPPSNTTVTVKPTEGNTP